MTDTSLDGASGAAVDHGGVIEIREAGGPSSDRDRDRDRDRVVPLQVPDFSRRLVCLFGLPFDAIGLDEAVDRIRQAAFNRRRLFVSTPNLNFVVNASQDAPFRRSILRSDLSLADGMPIVWMSRLFSRSLRERVAGADVFEALQAHGGAPVSVFLFGGPPGVAERACRRINERGGGLRCVGFDEAGFGSIDSMSSDDSIQRINDSAAQFVVVALGARKGQEWIVRNVERLHAPVVSHLGAVVNFAAGTVRRAPTWLGRTGFEWAWRMFEEPGLARRYASDAVAALTLVVKHLRSFASWRLAMPSTASTRRLQISIAKSGAMTSIVVTGDLGRDFPALRAALEELAPGTSNLRIDLSATTSCSNEAVATLLSACEWFSTRGAFAIDASPSVRRALKACMADDVLHAESTAGFATTGPSGGSVERRLP